MQRDRKSFGVTLHGPLRTKLTNKFANCVRVTLFLLWFCFPQRVPLQKDNFRRLLRTVEALSDLGPEMTAEREFPQTARAMLSASIEAGGSREGALFTYSDRPSLLTSVAADGFALMPEPAVIPLLPRHVHALTSSREPVMLDSGSYDVYISANGNVAPELFKCLVPLKVASKLVGVIAL